MTFSTGSTVSKLIVCADETPVVSSNLSVFTSSLDLPPIQRVLTLSSQMKRMPPFAVLALQSLSLTSEAVGQLQTSCPTLSDVGAEVSSEVVDHIKNRVEFQFVELDGLIYRKSLISNRPDHLRQKTLVIPQDYWGLSS